jgi:hypothetical protein
MPQKHIKRGHKVWVHKHESTFVSEFQIHTGKIGQAMEKKARVVHDLTKDFEGKNHHVYFDSCFTSVALMKALQENGIYACGTVKRGTVGMPKDSASERHMRSG